MFDTIFIILIIFLVLGGGLALLTNRYRKSKLAHLNILQEINVGKYLAGFDEHLSEIEVVFCNVSSDCFYFTTAGGKIIGKINKSSLTGIFLEDRTTVGQRLTATRLLTLGIFSLAAPK
jgi:hypothetical protein